MSTVKGTFAYCGFGLPAAIDFTCYGPHCSPLADFPTVTCTRPNKYALACSNGVVCDEIPQNTWYTDYEYELGEGKSTNATDTADTTDVEEDESSGTDAGSGHGNYGTNSTSPAGTGEGSHSCGGHSCYPTAAHEAEGEGETEDEAVLVIDGLVTSKQNTTITHPDCNYTFEVDATTSDPHGSGSGSGTVVITPSTNSTTGSDPWTYGHDPVPGSYSPSNTTGPTCGSGAVGSCPGADETPFATAGATSTCPRGIKMPYIMTFLLMLGAFLPGALAALHGGHEHRGLAHPQVAGANLAARANYDNPICEALGYPMASSSKTKRSLPSSLSSLIKRTTTTTAVAEEKTLESALLTFWTDARTFISSAVFGSQGQESYGTCYQAELASTTCAAWHGPGAKEVIVNELLPACIATLSSLSTASMSPTEKLALSVSTGYMCHWFVAEALEVVSCFEELMCTNYFEELLPEGKCEAGGERMMDVEEGGDRMGMESVNYLAGGGLAGNPEKCGMFFNKCNSNLCVDGVCVVG